ncbi:MAG: hypothetical protein AB1489_19945 [Acidobacteriota bacterium]
MRFYTCLLSAMLVLTSAAMTFAQRSSSNTRIDPNRGRVDMSEREQGLRNLELERERIKRQKQIDPSMALQLEVNREIQELKQASDALRVALVDTEKDRLKDIAKLAEKIAKTSKKLRQTLNDGESVSKVEPADPPSLSDQFTQLRQMAEGINKILNELNRGGEQLAMTVDAARIDETRKQLETLEGQALGIRVVARSKK